MSGTDLVVSNLDKARTRLIAARDAPAVKEILADKEYVEVREGGSSPAKVVKRTRDRNRKDALKAVKIVRCKGLHCGDFLLGLGVCAWLVMLHDEHRARPGAGT